MAFLKGEGGRKPGALNRAGRDVRELARAYTQGAIDGLWDIGRNTSNEPPVRVAAYRELLDRGWGKPREIISGDSTVTIVIAHKIGAIEAESGPMIEHSADDIHLVP